MMAPKASVIIPTYNRAHLISQAIDSVLQQTFSDFEIIVVDDGSTDDTEVVVKAYGDRVRYVWTPNGGIGHARNVGMEHARGRYFTFLDSDDLLYPYALELQTRLLERFPAVSMVCAEMTGFDDHGFLERYHLKNYHRSSFRDPSVTFAAIFESSMPLPDACAVPEDLLREDPSVLERRVYYGNIFDSYLLRIVLCQNTAMLRREVVAEIGPRNEHIYNYEELDYLLRLSRNHDILFADVPTYKLRYHDGQISTEARSDGMFIWIRKQRALLHVIKRHALADHTYYQRHRERLDRHLADLHRGVAVPMMLLGAGNAVGRKYGRYARYARLYLARCREYGNPQRVLYAASFAPGPFRRVAVAIIEGVRRDGVATFVDRLLTAILRHPLALMIKRPFRNLLWNFRGPKVNNPPIPSNVRSVLFVCFGNICRSPFAALIASRQLAARVDVAIRCDSAGIKTTQGGRSPKEACEVAADYGVSLVNHRPQMLTPSLVNAFDMVIVMESSQLQELRTLYPDAANRFFLLSLFATGRNSGYGRYNIADPFSQPRAAYEVCYRRIDDAVSRLLAAVVPSAQ